MVALFILVDCDNFFASCERIFRPDLRKQPVAVLSSNDACIIARSKEVKQLGIPMGAPLYLYKDALTKNGVTVFSANFSLYRAVSNRIHEYLLSITGIQDVEQYSVDEWFLSVCCDSYADAEKIGSEIQRQIYDWIGVPVSIGIAQTKTLAKVASWHAKQGEGIFCLRPELADLILGSMPAEEVWGIGRRYAKKLHARGIKTALQLKRMEPNLQKKLFNKVGITTILELHGKALIQNDLAYSDRKSYMHSRSFGAKITTIKEVESPIVNFITNLMQKIRDEGYVVGSATISLYSTRKINDYSIKYVQWKQKYERRLIIVQFAEMTDDSMVVIRALLGAFRSSIENWNVDNISKAGVIVSDLKKKHKTNLSLFELEGTEQAKAKKRSERLMRALDNINRDESLVEFGAAYERTKRWLPKSNLKSPLHLKTYEGLPKVI